MLLASHRAVPRRALDTGFRFAYPTIDEALAALIAPTAPSLAGRPRVPAGQ